MITLINDSGISSAVNTTNTTITAAARAAARADRNPKPEATSNPVLIPNPTKVTAGIIIITLSTLTQHYQHIIITRQHNMS